MTTRSPNRGLGDTAMRAHTPPDCVRQPAGQSRQMHIRLRRCTAAEQGMWCMHPSTSCPPPVCLRAELWRTHFCCHLLRFLVLFAASVPVGIRQVLSALSARSARGMLYISLSFVSHQMPVVLPAARAVAAADDDVSSPQWRNRLHLLGRKTERARNPAPRTDWLLRNESWGKGNVWHLAPPPDPKLMALVTERGKSLGTKTYPQKRGIREED